MGKGVSTLPDYVGLDEAINIEVLKELQRTLDWLKEHGPRIESIPIFAKRITAHKFRIFLAGKGRSGFVAMSFAMRLVHLGYKARFLGEPTSPPVRKGDLFIVISGSGENLKEETKTAKELGAEILLITSQKESPLAKMADIILVIPGREKEEQEMPYEQRKLQERPILPLGTAFELLTLIFCDSLVAYIAVISGQSESDLQGRHAKPI